MKLIPSFEYRKLGDFTYHLLNDPQEIKSHLTKWMLREWEQDHNEAPHEHWTVEWMQVFPGMEFSLEIVRLEDIHPHPDLWGLEQFQSELKERADDREWSVLRGVSIEPLVVNRQGFQLMDGYTRYVVLKCYEQGDVFAYEGHARSVTGFP
ncbi:MAG TPA: hypothetical protein VFY26_04475 [Anaerolineales bacterium]|nr:hypothetical protein [Anaerolineales bacterium]